MIQDQSGKDSRPVSSHQTSRLSLKNCGEYPACTACVHRKIVPNGKISVFGSQQFLDMKLRSESTYELGHVWKKVHEFC